MSSTRLCEPEIVLPLFDDPPAFDRTGLQARLASLAQRKIFIGTSSWRYEGWLNQVYTPERYLTRGRFSKKKFEQECIQEYAETFPIVSGDFSFYSIPEPAFWDKVFVPAPRQLKWDLKVPEDFTTKHFSQQPRYGARAGQHNPSFLDAELFQSAFLEPLSPYLDRIGVLLFEFGTFSKASYPEPGPFFDDLDAFLRRLPRGIRYAAEVRNDEFLHARYFDMLKSNGVAHVFSSWTRMPSLRQQIEIDDALTACHTAVRALVRPGRAYDQSVKLFSPYTEIKEEYPSARQALGALIDRCIALDVAAYIHINNRLEGNAVHTIAGILAARGS